MNLAVLHPDVQDYIDQNLKAVPTDLILKGVPFSRVSVAEAVEQIEAKSRCEKKLPTWFKTSNIYYSNKLNIEQTSSELTAVYKSGLMAGKALVDLTGGFGVDAFYFAKTFENVTHCEINAELSGIVKHNFEIFKVRNIQNLTVDGLVHLQNSSKTFDWIYIDPSRRHDSKGKVFYLKDCIPDIPSHLEVLWSRSKNIMIKTSPLLDITSGSNELEYVKAIHVVAINNEVKEILWILEHGFSGQISIKTTNLKHEITEFFDFIFEDEYKIEANYSEPLSYLYEPNAAIMKSGGFNALTTAFNVKKLHKHSHLYTSDTLIEFPGRVFKILKSIPYNKKQIKKLAIEKANITTRNFPESVQKLRTALKIKDGGDDYLFFTTDINNSKITLVCKKV